ncbi:uncharacterized protein BDCG_02093 [Blastomyces dermatitidis ER-3]|uniref:Uncharacterized protein n=1 Tax=Ajellomyces dermatitidis (strain ER-3 / ATCC MYA-2586) TaxID=559297 RepID=A0ABP2EXU2_AJEDR|nr:uncharacterized protein BDCG_02093 [Blastomyces dermatitidis ER-3]EEQ86973.1 hypothetical protein BDCG_02093 [Blastomyces dermatitidis ER-3]
MAEQQAQQAQGALEAQQPTNPPAPAPQQPRQQPANAWTPERRLRLLVEQIAKEGSGVVAQLREMKPKRDIVLREEKFEPQLKRATNVESALAHSRGTKATPPCGSCEKGHGPFVGLRPENQQSPAPANTGENEKEKGKGKKRAASVEPGQAARPYGPAKKKQVTFVALEDGEEDDEVSGSGATELELLRLRAEVHRLCKVEEEVKHLRRERDEAVGLLQMAQLSQQSASAGITALIKKFEK